MKKILSVAAMAIMAVAAVSFISSCGKDDDGGVLRTGRYSDDAITLDMGDGEMLDLSNDGKFVHRRYEIVRSSLPAVYATGSYKKTGKGQYDLVGYASLAITNKTATSATVVFTPEGDDESRSVEAIILEPTAVSAAAKKLCLTWTVESTDIEVSPAEGGNGVGRTFTGCDLNEIYSWLEKNEYYIDAQIPQNQKVDYIAAFPSGTLVLAFKNGNDYVANVDWSDFTGSALNYIWEHEGAGANILAADASFVVKGNKGILTFSGIVAGSNENYKASVVFNMKAAK